MLLDFFPKNNDAAPSIMASKENVLGINKEEGEEDVDGSDALDFVAVVRLATETACRSDVCFFKGEDGFEDEGMTLYEFESEDTAGTME